MIFFCGTCGSSGTKKRNEARAAAGPGNGDSGGPVRPLALFFAFNFVAIRQEEGVLHVDHEEEVCNTILYICIYRKSNDYFEEQSSLEMNVQ